MSSLIGEIIRCEEMRWLQKYKKGNLGEIIRCEERDDCKNTKRV